MKRTEGEEKKESEKRSDPGEDIIFGKTRVLQYLGVIGYGGIEAIIFGVTSEINDSKIDITYYSYSECSEDNMYYRTAIRRGRKVIFRQQRGRSRFTNFFLSIMDILKCCKEEHIDIVHYNISQPHEMLKTIPLMLAGYKVMIHVHNANVLGQSRSKIFFNKVMRQCSPLLPATLLACSDDAAKFSFSEKALARQGCTVIKNGINTRDFVYNEDTRTAVRNRLGIGDKFVIGHIGRFTYQKNHLFLLDVFSRICERCPEAVLLLVGDIAHGDTVEKVREKIQRFDLEKKVILYGTTDRACELYQAMDCFVFPSRFEGLGIVTIEAQAAGLKTLCSDRVPQEAKITELLEYMPLSDGPEKWAERILTYFVRYARRDMSEEIVAAGYDIKASANKLENIYLNRCAKVDE